MQMLLLVALRGNSALSGRVDSGGDSEDAGKPGLKPEAQVLVKHGPEHHEQEEGLDDENHEQNDVCLRLEPGGVVAEQEDGPEDAPRGHHQQVPVERGHDAEHGRHHVQDHRVTGQHHRLS